MNKTSIINYCKTFQLKQQPKWPNRKEYFKIIKELSSYPKIVNNHEIEALKKELIKAGRGTNFIIQGGDCAETFANFNANAIKNKLKILLQMSAIIQYSTNHQVSIIGRLAGQYIKPRTNQFEEREGIILPSYRGDGVNAIDFNKTKRQPNPKRLITAYHQSSSTMNLIRSLIMAGYTDINKINLWSKEIVKNNRLALKYGQIVKQIKTLLNFAQTSGIIKSSNQYMSSKNIYTSHEAILLDYENAFIFKKEKNKYYCCSAHMLWIGDRTRHINSAHIKFASLITNPIGVKIGPDIQIDDLHFLCQTINPKNKEGKLIFIVRLGIKKVEKILPKLIQTVKSNGYNVLWFCDPMHGNTINTKNGYKTRNFNTISKELKLFFQIHHIEKTIPGGIHCELTGENVTECLGGVNNIQDRDLDLRYNTACDPRLNNEQSLEVAFLISKLLKYKE